MTKAGQSNDLEMEEISFLRYFFLKKPLCFIFSLNMLITTTFLCVFSGSWVMCASAQKRRHSVSLLRHLIVCSMGSSLRNTEGLICPMMSCSLSQKMHMFVVVESDRGRFILAPEMKGTRFSLEADQDHLKKWVSVPDQGGKANSGPFKADQTWQVRIHNKNKTWIEVNDLFTEAGIQLL
ncbi:hypothetical protein ILYODFUR_038570 [Ilyodon furcidens]|uniref:Uncharacterized protein n=1 Tax=Ilyodon furcidens TaxID=33524 RepID=A0ABV0TEM9_9TELE